MKAVVLDTSVLIAGLLSPRGAAATLIDGFFGDRLALAYTSPILSEYVEVMERPEFVPIITPADRMSVLLKFRSSGVLVEPAPVPADNWPDADDLAFVAAALATEAKIIVTLKPRDFAPAPAHGLRILSPAEARRALL